MGATVSAESWVTDKDDPQGKYIGPSKHSSFPLVASSSDKRQKWYNTPESWLQCKIQDDDIDRALWRVHDKLYDLSSFIERHPGGPEWIRATRGMDITELFENSHVVGVRKVELMLKMFYVKLAPRPRNSPYTFEPKGFYKTLKKKIEPIMTEHGTGPTVAIRVIQDLMVVTVFTFSVLALIFNSYWLILAAGLLLGASTVSAHNFLHLRNNWRKYYFDLSLLSHYEWRVGHVFSHHGFPNTAWDAEILWLAPWIEFLTNRKKSWTQRFGSWFYVHFILAFASLTSFFFRVISIVIREQNVRLENFLPLAQLALFAVSCPGGILTGILFWALLHIFCSYYVTGTELMSAHHHPICFHDGDEPRAKPDYGLCILDATCVKVEDSSHSLLRTMTTFGEHNLHHLFPAVCISKILLIKPIVEETVKEFEEQLVFLTQWQIFRGMHNQMARCEPHSVQQNLELRHKTQGAKGFTSHNNLSDSNEEVCDALTTIAIDRT